MSKHFSTRWRRVSGFAFAEPAVDSRGRVDGRPEPAVTGRSGPAELQASLAELQVATAAPGRVVMLTGADGPGRALICDHLLAVGASTQLTVDGGSAVDADLASLLAGILTAYGFRAEPSTGTQVMAELIAHHAGEPDKESRRCLVVVRDAERLSARDLESLLSLVDGTALTLLLAGPAGLVAGVDKIARQSGLDWQELRLGDLSGADVHAYLHRRQPAILAAEGVGYGGSMRISEQRSRGRRRRPRPVQNPLEELLARIRARLDALAPAEGEAPGPLGFPRRHLVALGVLVLLLLVVYVIGQFAGNRRVAEPAQRVTTIATPALPAPESVAGPAGSGAAEEATDRPPVARPLAVPPVPVAAEEPSAESAPIIARPQAGTTAGPETGVPAVPSPPPAAPTPAPAAAPAPSAAPPPAPPASAPPAAAVSRPPASGSARGADWIMTQPGSRFTLQLVSLSSAERAQAYVAQQPDPGSFAVYRLLRNGQIFHVVIYGSYATRAEAEQAAGRLPASIGNVQPWVRQFSQVQESVRTALQQ